MEQYQQYLEQVYKWLVTSGLRVLAIIVISFVFIRIFRKLIMRSKDRIGSADRGGVEYVKRTETLAGLIEKTVRTIIITAAVLMILKSVGIDIGPLLAGAGVVGLAVGFGAQNLVKDVISGFFILLENQYNVGDVVEIAGKSGLIEGINLRVTTLRDLAGSVHMVPNGTITVVTNMTKEYSQALLDIGVAYKENVDDVVAVMKEVAATMRADNVFAPKILADFEVLGLDSFGDSSVNIKARFKTMPLEQWNVAREYRRRIKAAFDAKGIEIPFPHVTLYMGEGENTGVLRVITKESGGN
jgi:small conductance mechanosensitive channel